MKYVVVVEAPEYIEVEARSEEQAIEIVKNNVQDARLKAYARFSVCKEIQPVEDKNEERKTH